MSDFRSTTSFIKCEDLKINEKRWPSDYTVDNAYLKYTNVGGLEWFAASDALNNEDGGVLNDYIVMNPQKGGSGVTLSANTSSFIRAGPGQLVGAAIGGGPDGRGTGITYTQRGQITIGLTEEDADEGSTDISIHGSSLKQHTSITDREITIIGDKVKLQQPSYGEKLFQESPLSFKVSGGDIFKRENNTWIDENYISGLISNKTFINPHISGDILLPNGKSNVEYGIDTGNRGVLSGKKEFDGIFKNHKVIDENLSAKENEYKNWTVETIINSKKESNIIEEYNVGYQKVYGTFNEYNNPVDGENTFKYNDYYIGWNLSVSAYRKYNTSNNSTHIIRPGTVFKIVKGDPSVTYYETLTQVCKGSENTLFFENSYENYDSGTITIAGFATAAASSPHPADSTQVTAVDGNTITISTATTSFIPAKTNVVFTGTPTPDPESGIIENDVEVGSTTITLSATPPSGSYNISIKPFNSATTTLTKVNYSERIVDYTITKSPFQENTSITGDVTDESPNISINQTTTNTIPVGTTLQIGNYIFKVTGTVSSGGQSINVDYIGAETFTVPLDTVIYIKSFTGETLVNNDESRESDLSKNKNIIKTLSKQDVGSKFYISSQNKEHEKGIIYGDRLGKFLDDRKLNIYHREGEGFYIGWFIYLWNNKIPLSNSFVSDIISGTQIRFTNPSDDTDTLDITLGTNSLTNSPNTLTIPVGQIPEKNLDGYKITIKGFDSTTVSAGVVVTETTVADETAQLSLTPNKGDIIIRTSDSTTYIYNGGTPSSMSGYTLLSTISANVSRFTLSDAITSGVLPDLSRVIMVSGAISPGTTISNAVTETTTSINISQSTIGSISAQTKLQIGTHVFTVQSVVSSGGQVINVNALGGDSFTLPIGTSIETTKYFKVSTYDNSTKQITLISDSPIGDLSNYTINVYGMPENTTVELPRGIIEGYNSRLNTVQVALNKKSYSIDNNTIYCIKKGYTESGSGEKYCVNLDNNKILNDNYYNNWKIEVESEKNKGYYRNSSDYTINSYKKETLINNYTDDFTGILINSSTPLTLPPSLGPVEADYFKGWRIGISTAMDESTPNFSLSTTVRGYITSHGASIQDNTIPSNTTITNATTDTTGEGGATVSVLTIEPALSSPLPTNTTILVTSTDGTISKVVVYASTTTTLTLTSNESLSFVGGVVFMLTNISNVIVDWDGSTPDLTSTNLNFYITYNNSQWGDSHQRTIMYKTLKAEHISSDANENNLNRLTGFGELQAHSDNSVTVTTNRIKLLSNTDIGLLTDNAGVLETDFSPPSSEDDYYKGWKITLKFSSSYETFNIIKYSGTNNTATLDGTTSRPDQNYTVSAYILTKNLIHQEVIDNLFNINTYVTAINTTTNTLTLNGATKTTTNNDDFRTILLSPPRVFKSNTTINSMTNAIPTNTTISSEVTETTTSININQQTTATILVGTNLNIGTHVFTVQSEVSSGGQVINVNALGGSSFTLPIGTSITISYITVVLNSNMDSLIKSGVGVELISKDNTYKTTVFEDSTSLNTVELTYTTEINAIISTKDDYIINVIGESTTVPINTIVDSTNIKLETNPYYNVIGWYVSLYNDRKYKIYYDNYSGKSQITDGGLGFDLWSTLSNVNDFYKDWTLQLEEYFDQITETLDSSGNRVEEKFTKRSTFTIDQFIGLNKKVPRPPPGYTGADKGGTVFSSFNAYIIPSKTIKYGDNINNPTTNTTEYKLVSTYKTDKNKLIERGVMQKENTLSSLSSEIDDYYNGWEITTYNTITSKNDKLLIKYNDETSEKIINITHGSYSGSELASELKTKLDSATTGNFTISFSTSTQKITISTSVPFAFKWSKTHEHYLTNLHETLGFGKTDDSNYDANTVTSPNKISLYRTENGESSFIEKYDGTTKSFIISSLRSKRSMPSIGTKTSNKTQYILSPPEHISDKLTINTVNDIRINKDKSIENNDFYNGWDIITYTNGSYQSSHITDYDRITKKITVPSLDISTLSNSNTNYLLRNEKHLSGYLRKNTKTVFPSGDKKGVLSVIPIITHTYIAPNASDDTDPHGVSIHLYKDPTNNFKWFGLPQPSTSDDYYNNWKISIYVNNTVYHSTIRKYYGSDYKIILDNINNEIFLQTESATEIVYRYILYEPAYYMLSFDAIPVDDYYNGWLVNISNNNDYYSSIISDYQGKDRKIIVDGLPDNLDDSYSYELIESVEGVMSDTLKLSSNASEIKNYYVGWTISTLDSNSNIVDTSKITTYNSYDKSVTLDPAINSTDTTTKYKLYFNSDNSIFGKSSGKNIYTGSRNIVIGSNAGPVNTDNSVSDKLYIDSDTNTRGANSFIYGNMTRGSEELKVNADLRIPDAKMIYGDVTGSASGTSSFTTVDINGGAIDGTIIGANSHTTGKFTDVEATGNLTVTGDFTVDGLTTTVNTTSLLVEDPLIKLAKNSTVDTLDIGMYGQYNDGSTKYTGLFRDSDDSGKWKLFNGLTTAPTETDNPYVSRVPALTLATHTGTLVSNIEGNFIGFYDDSTNPGPLTVKLKAPSTLTGDGKNLILPDVATNSILVSTGDNGSVSTTMIADDAVTTDKIANTVTDLAATKGSATKIPVIVYDDAGCLTSVTEANISTKFPLSAGSGTAIDFELISHSLKFLNGTGVTASLADNSGDSNIKEITFDIGQSVGTTDSVEFTKVTSSTVELNSSGSIIFDGTSGGFKTTLTIDNPTIADNAISFPDNTGTIITTGSAGGVTPAMLANTITGAGPIGGSTAIPVITYDDAGCLTAVSTATISTSFTLQTDASTLESRTFELSTDTLKFIPGTGLTATQAHTATESVNRTDITFNLADTTVDNSGNYGSATAIPTLTIDAQGRITAASSTNISTSLTVIADGPTGSTGDPPVNNNQTSVSLITDNLTLAGGTGVDTARSTNTITFNIGQSVATDADPTFGTVDADLKGNVKASDGSTVVLNSGNGTTAATFTGDVTGTVSGSSGSCTGNAATASTAAVATRLSVDVEESTGNSQSILFADQDEANANGNLDVKCTTHDSSNKLIFAPSSGTVYATKFNGQLVGMADHTFVKGLLGDGNAVNNRFPIPFISGNNGTNSTATPAVLASDTSHHSGSRLRINHTSLDSEKLSYEVSTGTLYTNSIGLQGPVSSSDYDPGAAWTGDAPKWKIRIPRGYRPNNTTDARTYFDRNFQITTDDHGIHNMTSTTASTAVYGNVLIGGLLGNSSGLSEGAYNVYIGDRVVVGRTSLGLGNVGVGAACCTNINAGQYNTTVGYNSASSLTDGDYNACLGHQAGASVTSGNGNVCIGKGSGSVLSGGNNNISIGRGCGPDDTRKTYSNRMYIDAAEQTGNNTLIYGEQVNQQAHILRFNADVTIAAVADANGNNNSGKLTIEGPLHVPTHGAGTSGQVLKSGGPNGSLVWGTASSGSDPAPPELNKVLVGTGNTSGDWGMREFSAVCFLPGTKITLLNNIKINIEKLQKGDKLLSYKLDDMDPYTRLVDVLSWFSEEDTGEFSESEVSNIWSDKSLGYIIFNDKLHVTYEHLIFTKVDEEYTWLSAKEIRKGDIVFTDKGKYEEITKIEKVKEEVTVYNLRVTSSAMNYFADSYLVHNASLCDECAAKNNK